MDITRRWFIGGAASFGALSGCKVIPDPLGIWRAGRAVAPEFASGAKPVVKMDKAKRRGGKEPENALTVTFPAVPRSYEVRAWRYDVCLERPDGTLLKKKRVLASDFHLPLAAAEQEVKLAFLKKDLPTDGEVRVSVTPYECFGKAGKTIVSEAMKVEG